MANDLNQCTFTGRLGKDPETRYLGNGDPVTSFSIAVGWKSKEKEGTEWVNVVAFGKLAEICGEYLRKGSKVLIGGSMRTRSWDDKDGNKRYTTEIVADKMLMLDGKQAEPQQAPQQASYDAQKPKIPPAGGADFEDDIPFAAVMRCHSI